MEKSKVIAIDGPSGSGKSTIAKQVSKELDLVYLDTGAMFRGIAHYLDQQKISVDDLAKIESKLEEMDFQYAPSPDILIAIEGENLSAKIREHQVSRLASQYSQIPLIREYLKQAQRKIAKQKPSILEGRDIGSVIFPNAALKIFLTARPEVRAERRLKELQQRSPEQIFDLATIQADIETRDKADSDRDVAPLVKSEDAIVIDTSDKTLEAIKQEIVDLFEQRKNLFY